MMTNIEEAEQRIRRSKSLAGTNLNLGSLGLTTENLAHLIPIIAQELPNLYFLYLDNNNLESLPDSIESLSNINQLNLDNNNLESLPDSIGSLTNLSTLRLNNNNISIVSDSIVNLSDLQSMVLTRNPLYLISLLHISSIDNSQEIFRLNQADTVTLDRILDQSSTRFQNIARSVVGRYPAIGVEEFNTLYQSLNTHYPAISDEQVNTLSQNLNAAQIEGIIEFELPLSELGIGLDLNGNLSSELALTDTDLMLSELLDKTAEIKKITGKTSKEAFHFAKNKPAEYLQGILNFGLSEVQMDQMGSIENMRDIYQRINLKLLESSSLEEDYQLDLANLTDNEKDFVEIFFNDIIGKNISEQAGVENNDEQVPDQATQVEATSATDDSFCFSALTEALNSSRSNSGSVSSINSDSDSEKKTASKLSKRTNSRS